jgi:carboxyl-terminal processing protease
VLATEEKARADKDPDYRWLVADLAANDAMRKQTSLSLNLQARKAEREKLEKERLARENARRAAQGLPALKNSEELADAKLPDTVLDQATEVMTDMVTGVRPTHPAPTRTVRSESKKPG